MTDERKKQYDRLQALNAICLQCARRLALHESQITRELYEAKKAERDALRAEMFDM